MNPLLTLRIALRALLRNKMRSFLTTLGIIIGVAAVIAMVAIGEGAKAQVEKAFAAMGTSLLIVMPGTSTSGGARGGFGSQPTLTWDDLRAIQAEVPSVRSAAPVLRSSGQIVSEDQNWTSQTVAKKLFGPSADPVGQVVRIKNTPFQVIGVLQGKGQSPTGQDYDDGAFVPVTTFQAKIQGGLQKFLSGTIFVSALSAEETARAQTAITNLLRDRHNIRRGTDDDFSIRNLTEIAGAQQEGTETLTTLLASIALVSLLVGGIGIMNIMLVSVTERTREIGVRMAVGAKPHHIMAQFLVEALALSVMGGLIGVGIGIAAGARIAARFGWPILVRPDIVFISVAFSALVGIGFGLYPARKASRLDPIEALRYE